MSRSLIRSVRESAGMRLAVLFGSFFILLLLSSIISTVISASSFGSERDHMLISSVLQCVLAFCLPAFILSRFSSNSPLNWLDLTRAPKLRAIIGVLIVYIVSMPVMEWLIDWNANLHFPESMASVENLLRDWEDSSEAATKILLDAHGWVAVTVGVLVIGVLTGFSEELFFRGGLQGIFSRSSMGRGAAVWMAAIIFSTMHFQFFGFVPRLLMGVFFGYLLVWTGSLWVPMFAHILNNSAVVIASALSGGATSSLFDSSNPELYFGNSLSVAGSVLFTALFFIFGRDFIFKNNRTRRARWQKNQLPRVTEK